MITASHVSLLSELPCTIPYWKELKNPKQDNGYKV